MMKRKWKLAVAALLGFSTACSTVRQAPKQPASKDQTKPRTADTTAIKARPVPPRIVLMYGVRPPVSDSVRIRRMERQLPDSLPPVAEEPREEDPAVKK